MTRCALSHWAGFVLLDASRAETPRDGSVSHNVRVVSLPLRGAARPVAAVIALVAVALAVALPAPALAGTSHQAAKKALARPSIKAPAVAIEGARFAVTVSVPTSRQATTIQLQFHDQHDYDYQSTLAWTNKATMRVKGRRQVTFHLHADQAHEAWFRGVVTYRGANRPAASSAVRVNYQHWFPLSAFDRYYSAGSAIDLLSFSMAGSAWNGWYANGSAGESRYTLGGGCVRFRGAVGVTDSSSDGATGVVTLATIAPGGTSTPLYTSPDLVAGQTVRVDLPLAKPYRFSIAGQDTTPAVTDGSRQPRAYAALGDPEFLCHFN